MKKISELAMYYGASARLFVFAKEMRKNPTKSEEAMWEILNSPTFTGQKFRRQHPIGKAIADFYCHSLKLVIEVDGGYHTGKEQAEYDIVRDEDMRQVNILVIRFSNNEVLNQKDIVIDKIQRIIENISTP